MNTLPKLKRQASTGRPLNSSASSLSVRFDVTTEQIEDAYFSDEDKVEIGKFSINSNVHDDFDTIPGSSKLLHLSRLSKRSTSIDTAALLAGQDSSPPTDPWKFLSEIKGKITKSVEDKITEIKSRQEESSPKKSKLSKQKENSSFSDSEDISESSISKTCGVYSTTEGPEMSSEEDDEPGNVKKKMAKSSSKKFKLLKNRNKVREGYININALRNIYEVATGLQADRSDDSMDDVESAVDALEENYLHSRKHSAISTEEKGKKDNPEDKTEQDFEGKKSVHDFKSSANNLEEKNSDSLIQTLAEEIENISIDPTDNSICINDVKGSEISSADNCKTVKTYFAPQGFVDMRPAKKDSDNNLMGTQVSLLLALLVVIFSISIYFWSFLLSSSLGFITGVGFTILVIVLINKFTGKSLFNNISQPEENYQLQVADKLPVFEITAAKEYKPLKKFEKKILQGWMNEYPENYDHYTYHISDTQSVYVKLQGNILRISHTKAKVPKRGLWNQPKFKATFTHHRIYNLYGAKITLAPNGLIKKRHWSKKYPICITLKEDQVKFLYPSENDEEEKDEDIKDKKGKKFDEKKKGKHSKKKKKKSNHQKPQIFSKLFEKDDFGIGGASDDDSPLLSDEGEDKNTESPLENVEKTSEQSKEDLSESQNESDGVGSFIDGWEVTTPFKGSPSETCLYLFGRTAREKEDWFRRFKAATLKKEQTCQERASKDWSCSSENASKGDFQEQEVEIDFLKYMARYQLNRRQSDDRGKELNDNDRKNSKDKSSGEDEDADNKDNPNLPLNNNLLWFNVLVGRIMFDVLTYSQVSNSLKSLIQRKLSGIKLPYFIEELTLKDLHLGNGAPIFHKVKQPYIDERGLWIDLDMSYEGCFSIYVYTKLNLMKLKQPPPSIEKNDQKECSAIYNSDIEDSAETSSDDDSAYIVTLEQQNSVVECPSTPGGSSGGSGNTGKKIIKMVDKIAESKFFQKAAENRFVKKAMEGVSNTDFGIKVEVKRLSGVLAVNIPPPPSDRLWYGFRPVPLLSLSAHPIVGEKNITFIQVKNWIEKKLVLEFQKVLVIPNMDDLYLPILSPLVPDKP